MIPEGLSIPGTWYFAGFFSIILCFFVGLAYGLVQSLIDSGERE